MKHQERKKALLGKRRQVGVTDVLKRMVENIDKLTEDQLTEMLSTVSTQDLLSLAKTNKKFYHLLSQKGTLAHIGQLRNPELKATEGLCEVAFSGGLKCPHPWDPASSFLGNQLSECKEYCKKPLLNKLEKLRYWGNLLLSWVVAHPTDIIRVEPDPHFDIPARGGDLRSYAIVVKYEDRKEDHYEVFDQLPDNTARFHEFVDQVQRNPRRIIGIHLHFDVIPEEIEVSDRQADHPNAYLGWLLNPMNHDKRLAILVREVSTDEDQTLPYSFVSLSD